MAVMHRAMQIAEDDLQQIIRLNSCQVAHYVRDGFLRFDSLVPPHLNEQIMSRFREGLLLRHGRYRCDASSGLVPFTAEVFGEDRPLRDIFALPRIQGAIRSLLGPAPFFDHHAVHVIGPRARGNVDWHPDSEMELREHPDLLVMYFPHNTPREMGGTMILPGSHLHSVRCSAASRYDNYLGQQAMVCPVGTVVLMHPAVWHCGQPNRSESPRLMYKIRLCPGKPAGPTWNTEDLNDPEVVRILSSTHAWEQGDHQVAIAQRLRWWRALSGQIDLDIGSWLIRQEHRAGVPPVRVTRSGTFLPSMP
jgi:hypothetical protein